MMAYARGALGKVPKKVFLPEIEVKNVISIEEMIDKLTERIKDSMKMNFKDFALSKGGRQGEPITKEEKVNMIVGFLAMLELVRNGMLNAVQENNFEDIIIEKQEEKEVESL